MVMCLKKKKIYNYCLSIKVTSSELHFSFQTPASNFPGISDDLVYSGAGCQNDDEDTCVPVVDPSSGDDLITPVYVPPTRVPIPARKEPPESMKPCDDEDCGGSGAGELTTEDSIIKGK